MANNLGRPWSFTPETLGRATPLTLPTSPRGATRRVASRRGQRSGRRKQPEGTGFSCRPERSEGPHCRVPRVNFGTSGMRSFAALRMTRDMRVEANKITSSQMRSLWNRILFLRPQWCFFIPRYFSCHRCPTIPRRHTPATPRKMGGAAASGRCLAHVMFAGHFLSSSEGKERR
jgi:hypothetical protein